MLENTEQINYKLTEDGEPGGEPGTILTVELESSPGGNNSVWICPELDGYRERGEKMRLALEGANIGGEMWVTEWGYPSVSSGIEIASYPPALQEHAEETQARWLMRGFLEYDASAFDASFWHWFQDGSTSNWDAVCGTITESGSPKTSWFYLHNMINEIGDKKKTGEYFLSEDCELNDVPIATFSGGEIVPDNPNTTCPKIYKYSTGETCGNESCFEDYNESVWVIWLPYMLNFNEEQQVKTLVSLSELGISSTDGPQQYYYNIPSKGKVDGENSVFSTINSGDNGVGMVNLPITEKPIFLHLRGEQACVNTMQNSQSDGCSYEFETDYFDSSCTQLQVKITVNPLGNNCSGIPSINLASVFASIGSENEMPYTFTNFSNVEQGDEVNEFIITMDGLAPDTEYSFSFGTELIQNGNFGYIGGETDSFFTASAEDNCYDNLSAGVCSEPLLTYGHDGSTEININAGDFTSNELSDIRLVGCLYELDDNEERVAACDPITPVPFFDWSELEDSDFSHTATCILPTLSPSTRYEVEYFLVNVDQSIRKGPFMCFFDVGTELDPDSNHFSSGDGVGKVTEVIPSSDVNCSYSLSFTPVTTIIFTTELDGNGDEILVETETTILQYDYILRDQDFNKVSNFVQFSEGDIDVDGKLNITNIDISNLQSPPFIGQLLAKAPGGQADGYLKFHTNSVRFDLPTCCVATPPTFPIPSTTFNFNKCFSHYAYVQFCDESPEGFCPEGVDITVESHFDSETVYSHGDGCYTVVLFKEEKMSCDLYNVTISSHFFGDIIQSFTTFVDYTSCDCPVDIEPTRNNFIEMDPDKLVFTDDSKIIMNVKMEELENRIRQSREYGVPVFYVIQDAFTDKILAIRPYYNSVNFTLSTILTDSEALNERYKVHLLLGRSFYDLDFPDLNPFQQGFQYQTNGGVETSAELNIYPNPTKDNVTIEMKEKTIKKVILFNLIGQKIIEKDVDNYNITLPLNSVNEGIYLIEVHTEDGQKLLEKLIISN